MLVVSCFSVTGASISHCAQIWLWFHECTNVHPLGRKTFHQGGCLRGELCFFASWEKNISSGWLLKGGTLFLCLCGQCFTNYCFLPKFCRDPQFFLKVALCLMMVQILSSWDEKFSADWLLHEGGGWMVASWGGGGGFCCFLRASGWLDLNETLINEGQEIKWGDPSINK